MSHNLIMPRCWFFDFVKITAAIPGLIWLRPKRQFESSRARQLIRGGALIASNHSSYLDPVYLQFAIGYRRQRFVCMKEFFDGPVNRWFFTHFLCIPVDRENTSMKTMHEVVDALREDWLVTIFPEGHISKGGTEMFKTGIILMAAQSECPIIPVFIRRPERWWNRLRVCIGEPVDVIGICGGKPNLRQMREISEMLREKEERLKMLCK